ncbi:MAG TPA: polysaccharide lyase family 7 protein [Aeromicrobium sp.]|nr:polysaccharide lyase family 7 protein [Aeromicrobium sp.]
MLASSVLDLSRWKLTLPTGHARHPAEVRQPQLGGFRGDAHFHLDATREGVVFHAPVGGVTTKNSTYPRSELREMVPGGSREAAGSNRAGQHVLSVTEAITATPRVKPHVVAAQVHDADDDVIMIRLEGRRLFVESGGEDVGVLDPDYRLGTRFTIGIVASPAGIRVFHRAAGAPRTQVVRVRKVGGGMYFKVGCYTQSNRSRGDLPTAYGEVVVYALSVRH